MAHILELLETPTKDIQPTQDYPVMEMTIGNGAVHMS